MYRSVSYVEVLISFLYIYSIYVEFFQGNRYRFRVINAEFLNCPIEMSVDNHTITVITSEGNDLEPVEGLTNLHKYI